MGVQRRLQKVVINISIFCIFLNLVLIFVSQCYLLFQARKTTNNIMSTNSNKTKQFDVPKNFCLHHKHAQKEKSDYKRNYSVEFVTIVGSTSLIEVFIDLPINILLYYGVDANQKTFIFPWLIFNGLRIIITVVAVCVFVIFAIVGVEQFMATKKHLLLTYCLGLLMSTTLVLPLIYIWTIVKNLYEEMLQEEKEKENTSTIRFILGPDIRTLPSILDPFGLSRTLSKEQLKTSI